MRTTLDISDEAYYIAKAIARDQNRRLGRVVGDLILQLKGRPGAAIEMSDYGFPIFSLRAACYFEGHNGTGR